MSSSSVRVPPASRARRRSRRQDTRRSCSSAPTRSAAECGPTSSTDSCSTTASRCFLSRIPRRERCSTTTGSTSASSRAVRSSAPTDGSGGSPTHVRRRSGASGRSRAASIGVRDGAAVMKLLRGSDDETTSAEALRRAGVSRATVERFFAPFLRGIFLEERLTTSSRFLDFVLKAFAEGPAALPRGGMGSIASQLAAGLDVRTGTAVATIGPNAVSLETGEQLRAEAVVVATSGIVDEPVHGWNGVTCVYYDAPSDTRFPARGSWSTAKVVRSTTSASRARQLRATRRPDARSSRCRSSAPESLTSMLSWPSCEAGSGAA